jgi:hypothetical protein
VQAAPEHASAEARAQCYASVVLDAVAKRVRNPSMSRLFPTMFRPAKTSHSPIDVSIFVQLMNQAQICCALCSKFISDADQWPKWTVTLHSSFTNFLVLKSKTAAASNFTVATVTQNDELQKAYYCLSMVAVFFNTKARDDLNESDIESLFYSVSSDIHCRFIHHTLAHLSFLSSK